MRIHTISKMWVTLRPGTSWWFSSAGLRQTHVGQMICGRLWYFMIFPWHFHSSSITSSFPMKHISYTCYSMILHLYRCGSVMVCLKMGALPNSYMSMKWSWYLVDISMMFLQFPMTCQWLSMFQWYVNHVSLFSHDIREVFYFILYPAEGTCFNDLRCLFCRFKQRPRISVPRRNGEWGWGPRRAGVHHL